MELELILEVSIDADDVEPVPKEAVDEDSEKLDMEELGRTEKVDDSKLFKLVED